jgi:hypothetical protein
MTYRKHRNHRKRRKPGQDPETGVTYARQLREVPDCYRYTPEEGKPRGAFDLEYWAEENDSDCDPREGGLANIASMAAVGRVSRHTLVNSVFPRIEHCLHREGPVVISVTNTIVAGCREYVQEQRAKQRDAGRRNARNLIRWGSPTDPSSGLTLVG